MTYRSMTEIQHQLVQIPCGDRTLEGQLTVPPEAEGLVLFVHGSGSSRFSPRNQCVAATLNTAGFGTLLFDLLTYEEANIDKYTFELRFDIELLAERTIAATDWVLQDPMLRSLNIGYFGASTGSAAALIAAARRSAIIKAVVSRGGRPELAGSDLDLVKAPTLLLVGERDVQVICWNEQALDDINTEDKKLVIIPDAGHLFEEPGKLEEVAEFATLWFVKHLNTHAHHHQT